MSQWIWQHKGWPNFAWDEQVINELVAKARLNQGKLLGSVAHFVAKTQDEMTLQVMTEEIMTTSAIEGEILNRDSVHSSIARRLNLPNAGVSAPPNRYVEGLLEVLLDASENYAEPLTLERLFAWQAALFPTGYSGIKKIIVAALRGEGDMKIISGRIGKERIHYIAPPYQSLQKQMEVFLAFFNGKKEIDGLVRAGLAHLWFEILHPFDDGNGRLGRVIIDMALAQDEQLATRFYSVSSQIMKERKGYYQVLEQCSLCNMDVTAWLKWFLQCYNRVIETSLNSIEVIIAKSQFWQYHAQTILNARQQKVLNKLLGAGPNNFVGGMTTKKYMSIARVSRVTAYRELKDLVEKKCLRASSAKGRSSAYEINWPAASEGG